MAEYGTMFNKDRTDLSAAIPLATPFVIQLEPSGFCNLRCGFCPVNDKSVRQYFRKQLMTPELFSLFLRQCGDFPQKIKVLRLIGNGEPLMNRHIVDFVKRAKDSGVFEKVEITSNGTLMDAALSDALVDAGLDTLKISLEAADEKTFAEIAGVKVNSARLYNELAYFYQNRGRSKLYIKTTDAALHNREEQERFLAIYGNISDYIFIESVTDLWPEYTSGMEQKHRYGLAAATDRPVCIQPFDLLSVSAGGDVGPCCADWKGLLTLGNMNKVSLVELWNGKKLRELRVGLLEHNPPALCGNCGFPAVSQSDYIDEARTEILARIKEL